MKKTGNSLKVLTANVRVSSAQDGPNAWELRKNYCAEVILAEKPDAICGQEISPEQFEFFKDKFADYDSFALLESPARPRPQNAVYYLRERFELVGCSGYWLSETPHVTGSGSWNTSCIRFANWVWLADRWNNGRHIRILNCHLDHISSEAREGQAKVMAEEAAAYPPDFAQVLTGDFNCDGDSPPLEILRQAGWKDSYGAVHGTETPGIGSSYHHFLGAGYVDHFAEKETYYDQLDKIDWVMSRGAIEAVDARIIPNEREDIFYSDHYFVTGVFKLL